MRSLNISPDAKNHLIEKKTTKKKKNKMLGKIEDRRRRGKQRMR